MQLKEESKHVNISISDLSEDFYTANQPPILSDQQVGHAFDQGGMSQSPMHHPNGLESYINFNKEREKARRIVTDNSISPHNSSGSGRKRKPLNFMVTPFSQT